MPRPADEGKCLTIPLLEPYLDHTAHFLRQHLPFDRYLPDPHGCLHLALLEIWFLLLQRDHRAPCNCQHVMVRKATLLKPLYLFELLFAQHIL